MIKYKPYVSLSVVLRSKYDLNPKFKTLAVGSCFCALVVWFDTWQHDDAGNSYQHQNMFIGVIRLFFTLARANNYRASLSRSVKYLSLYLLFEPIPRFSASAGIASIHLLSFGVFVLACPPFFLVLFVLRFPSCGAQSLRSDLNCKNYPHSTAATVTVTVNATLQTTLRVRPPTPTHNTYKITHTHTPNRNVFHCDRTE